MAAHLNCPECDAEVFPTDDEACLVCGKGTDEHDATAHAPGEPCQMGAVWYDDERCTCPDCGASLRVSADGERAWVDTTEAGGASPRDPGGSNPGGLSAVSPTREGA